MPAGPVDDLPLSAAVLLVAGGVTAGTIGAAAAVPGLGGSPAAASHCAETILLAMAPLAASLVAMRAGAPTRPAAAGAAAGLLSGGLAATAFALYCPMDSAVQVLLAYGTAIPLLAGLGAVAGRRVLAR